MKGLSRLMVVAGGWWDSVLESLRSGIEDGSLLCGCLLCGGSGMTKMTSGGWCAVCLALLMYAGSQNIPGCSSLALPSQRGQRGGERWTARAAAGWPDRWAFL